MGIARHGVAIMFTTLLACFSFVGVCFASEGGAGSLVAGEATLAQQIGAQSGGTIDINDVTVESLPTMRVSRDGYWDESEVPWPEVALSYNGVKLVKDTDYYVVTGSYEVSGKGYITAYGMGDYAGFRVLEFAVEEMPDLSDATVTVNDDSCYYVVDYDPYGSRYVSEKSVKPTIKVMYNGKELVLNRDYTIEYPAEYYAEDDRPIDYADDLDPYYHAGAYVERSLTIVGAGDYAGWASAQYQVLCRESLWTLNGFNTYYKVKDDYDYVIPNQTYTGKAIMPSVKVDYYDYNDYEDVSLVNGKDYEVSYSNNVNPGTATVTVTGKGIYAGSLEETFKIIYPMSKTAVGNIGAQQITGKQVKPKPSIKKGAATLKEGTDYTLSYKNNVNAGTATVTATGKGLYGGSVSKTFKINGAINKSFVQVSAIADQVYNGKAKTPKPVVKFKLFDAKGKQTGYKTLKLNADYTLAYKNNKKIGTATVTVKGIGAYSGSMNVSFKICNSLGKAKATLKAKVNYTGKALKPKPTVTYGKKTLKLNRDYAVSYSNNKMPGKATMTIKGKGSYTGTIKKTFKVIGDLSKAKIAKIATQIPMSKAMKPKPSVTFASMELISGEDYTVSYKNNTKGGTATVTIKGKGYFKGSKSAKFKILPRGTGKAITKAEFNRIKLGMTYGEVKCLIGGGGSITYEYDDPYGSYEDIYDDDGNWIDTDYTTVKHRTYEWKGNKSYSGASLAFVDGELTSKSQWGL